MLHANLRERRLAIACVLLQLVIHSAPSAAGVQPGEPDPATYWQVKDIRAGMKGHGVTVVSGVEKTRFCAEVLSVMRGVSPGRDMILCRLSGAGVEHSGIVQGMSGSPIYVDGKLLGAVAYAWEFAKDPIAGVTPFEQMLTFTRDEHWREVPGIKSVDIWNQDDAFLSAGMAPPANPLGMKPIGTVLSCRGMSPRALALVRDCLGRSLTMSASEGSGVQPDVLSRHGDLPLEPGSAVGVTLMSGDFDLSGIGTVTHVEGNRVWAFGHPMEGFGKCDFPLTNAYIHTTYPRLSVSMKLGSPMQVLGVLDTDVSTAVAGRIGESHRADMLPVRITVSGAQFPSTREVNVSIVREPSLMAPLLVTALTGAIDTHGTLPTSMTAEVNTTVRLDGMPDLTLNNILSGSRYEGKDGPVRMFGPTAQSIALLANNWFGKARIESIDARITITPVRRVADLDAMSLSSDRVKPGGVVRATVKLDPYRAKREMVEIEVHIPDGTPEGTYELTVADAPTMMRRKLRSHPSLTEPRDMDALVNSIREQWRLSETTLYAYVDLHVQGVEVDGQPLPNLPGSVMAVLNASREKAPSPYGQDEIGSTETSWVLAGSLSKKFTVSKDADLPR